MRMERPAVGKSKGGDFMGERVEGWGGTSLVGILRARKTRSG